VLALGALFLLSAAAQEETLDLLDGETLYEDGWLFTLSADVVDKGRLLDGRDRESDPLDARLLEENVTVAAHYGLRHDLQLSAIVPYAFRELRLDDPAGPDRFSAHGPGDATLAAKWRYYRPAIEGTAFNFATVGGLELPTGSASERDHGARLPAELQPGSGSWDPFFGTGFTYEPGRWRVNVFGFYKHNGEGSHDYKHGDQLFFELAGGNRFWVEPYPGPFMRADLLLRYRHEWRDRDGGSIVHDSGGDELSVGLNWAFRPRPSLDFQVLTEVPVYQSVEGVQRVKVVSVFLAFGVRL
jgi:hypothetical protein